MSSKSSEVKSVSIGSQRRRRTAEETQKLLLEAGAQLAIQSLNATEASGGGPLAHIRVSDVCREASRLAGSTITTGAAYHLWPNQKAFQVDLMFHILEAGAFTSVDDVVSLAAELFAARVPFAEIGERLVDESFRVEIESPVTRAAIAFKALAGVPAVRDALRAAHESFIESGRRLYEQLLTYGGLRMREPYTLEQMMTVMGALAEGLQVTHGFVPEQFDTPPGSPSLVATASAAVFNSFCEPDPEAMTGGS